MSERTSNKTAPPKRAPAKRRAAGRDRIDGMSDALLAELPDLDRPEFELVKRAARLGVMLQDALSSVLSPWGLTRPEYGALSSLRAVGKPHELRPTDLKPRLMLSSSAVANVLNRLEAAGLIERERDANDARSSWVRLTDKGIETAEAAIEAWSAAQTEMFRPVSPELSHAGGDVLRRVLLALGDVEAPPARTR